MSSGTTDGQMAPVKRSNLTPLPEFENWNPKKVAKPDKVDFDSLIAANPQRDRFLIMQEAFKIHNENLCTMLNDLAEVRARNA
jgi:hypothetical protein